ncbi:MAG: NADH-quinone oxidoreductase subunit NuoH [Pirellulales bacterium]|nr:NADH-quinone oxidoreductase subunit NuoH [Pirellulales bacterium]
MAELLTSISTPDWLAHTIAALVQCGLLLAIALCSAAVGIWLERKVSARIQDRLGPTRVGGKFGWLQPPADGLKLICKEDIIPTAADHILFRIAPYISFCAVFCVFLALPFANGWVAVELNAGAFFLLAVLGLEIFGVILGGYASGSKWSLYGAMREAAQVVSYEIPLGLCVVVPVILAGTMNLVEIGNQQAGWFFNWYLFHDPFTFVVFWVYVTCAVASSNRAPFDLPEAESELVAGFLTEYSGFRWVFFFMGEYASMFVVSGLGALLFLGGWNGPIPIASLLGLTPENHDLLGWMGNLLGMCNFIAKAFLGMTFMIWLRWTLPRLRIDQVITTCLKYCVPIVSAMLAGVMLWCFFLPGGLFVALTQPASFTRSAWEHTDSTLRVDEPRDNGRVQEEAWRQSLPALRSHAEYGNEENI